MLAAKRNTRALKLAPQQREHTTKKRKKFDLGTSLLPDILS
jgi:hypothetical protein